MPKGKGGASAIRASFADAKQDAARQAEHYDPPAQVRGVGQPRRVTVRGKEEEIEAGEWLGWPHDRLPPDCPVAPLGVDGKAAYFVDTLGQLIGVSTSEWGKKILLQLFMMTPNYLEWAWPKFSQKGGINGVEVDAACACLLKAAGQRGLFQPIDRVRGRGAWTDDYGRLIWHSGDRLYVVDDGGLQSSPPGEIDGLFYPTRPLTMEPWPEPVDHEETPAQQIFADLCTWAWGRSLDPLIVLGGIGCMMVGGALPWRPHLFITGDKGVGKTELQRLVKRVLLSALHDCGNTTEAGVRQRLGLDTLPVYVDEMEASEDNRRVMAIVELARLASSGQRLFRGGADHKGIEFQARSTFFMSGIIPPPIKPQDKSRIVMVDLGKLKDVGEPPRVAPEAGRMILRSLMDNWHDFDRAFADMRALLKRADFDGRQQDTYGSLLAVAELMLGRKALIASGYPIDDRDKLGAMVAEATVSERSETLENWRECLEHLLGSNIDAWRGGERPTVGGLIADFEAPQPEQAMTLAGARDRLATAGLGLQQEPIEGEPGKRKTLIAVPRKSPALGRLFANTQWQNGGWWTSLKQGIASGAVRPPKIVKINRMAAHCLMIDLAAYDEIAGGGE